MKDKILAVLIVVFVIIAVFLSVSLVMDISRLHREGNFGRPNITHNFLQNTGVAPVPKVHLIAAWMTFNYVNKSFNLPKDYLKTELGIKSKAYPNLTIAKAAAENKVSTINYLTTLRETVLLYFVQTGTTGE